VQLADHLKETLGREIECSPLEGTTAAPAAIYGLQSSVEGNEAQLPLVLRSKDSRAAYAAGGARKWSGIDSVVQQTREALTQVEVRKWAIRIALLAAIALLFPVIEALVMKRYFAKKISVLNTQKSRLGVIDRELSFLQFLKQSQPPYLDTLAIIASDTPPGTRLDSVSMNRRGEVALKGSMQNATQVSDFRSKLIKSGFFAAVTVEEQTPTPDRQKINLRMSALIKPLPARAGISVDTIVSNAPPLPPGGSFPGGGNFGGPPPGMAFPPGMSMPAGMPPEMMGGMPPGARPSRKGPSSLTSRYGISGATGASTNRSSTNIKIETNGALPEGAISVTPDSKN
jgi:hypothetical protein